jgi:hypothetical protein
MSAPSSQGPCICPEGGVVHACPRHAYMWDYVGQSPFKDHLHPRPSCDSCCDRFQCCCGFEADR